MNNAPMLSQPKCAPVYLTQGRVTSWYMLCKSCKPQVLQKEKSKKSAQASALLHMRTQHQWMPNAIRNL